MANKIIHKRSSALLENGNPKLPTADNLEYGELAINFADGVETISLKNKSNEIVEFRTKEYFEKIISDNQELNQSAIDDINNIITGIDNRLLDVEDNKQGFLTEIPSDYITENELNTTLDNRDYATKGELQLVDAEVAVATGLVNSLTQEFINTELVVSTALNTLNTKIERAINKDELLAIQQNVNNNTNKINELNTKIDDKASNEHTHNEFETINNVIINNELVISSALNNLNERVITLENDNNSESNKITDIENRITLPDSRSKLLWLGTSIPAGDISIDPEQINTYPRMVADVLGFDLYNQSKAGSLVTWYPQSPSWTTSAQVAAEFPTAYCLSATRQEIYDKYYNVLNTIRRNEGLSTTWRDDYLNDFMDSSFESRILPYIDGTIANCDAVVIDHGFNDRSNIFAVCQQHVTADKDSISVWGPGSGADGVEYPVIGGNAGWWWLTHLSDGRYYDGEVYMNTVYAVANGFAGDNTGGMRGEYFGAMAYIIAKIQQINPRIRIIIGNYFSQDYGSAVGDGMNSFTTKYILEANQQIANYYGFPCVNVYKHTGLRNRNIRKPDGTTISDMFYFCPDGVHPASDLTGQSNKVIAGAYINALYGALYN